VRHAQQAVDAAVAPVPDWWRHQDLLLTPATFQPAWPLGTDAGPAENGTLTAPFSFSGQPALAVPAGHTAEGLPVGVQIVGRAGGDGLLLHLAATLQDAMGWTTRHPDG
jgi:amidase